ncbi:hypothetical protein PVK73_27930 [Bacillus thuringiensis]
MLKELNEELEKLQNTHDLFKSPFILFGGIMLLGTKEQLQRLKPLLEELTQTVSKKRELNRIVVYAYSD